KEKLHRVLEVKNLQLMNIYHKEPLAEEDIYQKLLSYREQIKDFVADTNAYLQNAVKTGKTILLEGQLGTLKDTDSGIYPMVTSSHTLAAYGAVGAAGIPPYELKEIVAVTKAYSSAVGAGEFVSELLDPEEAQELRLHGGDKGEFGATTGRPRRVGWFDTVATRYGVKTQGATEVVLTAVDCLSYLEELKICVGYEIDGEVTKDFPVTPKLKKAKPVYKEMKGWHCDIRGIRNFEDLPKECQDYVRFIEQEIETPITMVSNGPEREAIIHR
ncbi:MAG TPA: adenylosuccinate synthetase, partial [Clostridiales bacterium]|nr:adenylosuccinate synthetase [Clostridiales bacterium]